MYLFQHMSHYIYPTGTWYIYRICPFHTYLSIHTYIIRYIAVHHFKHMSHYIFPKGTWYIYRIWPFHKSLMILYRFEAGSYKSSNHSYFGWNWASLTLVRVLKRPQGVLGCGGNSYPPPQFSDDWQGLSPAGLTGWPGRTTAHAPEHQHSMRGLHYTVRLPNPVARPPTKSRRADKRHSDYQKCYRRSSMCSRGFLIMTVRQTEARQTEARQTEARQISIVCDICSKITTIKRTCLRFHNSWFSYIFVSNSVGL